VTCHDSGPSLPPGAPFKRQTKKIVEGRQNLAGIVRSEDPSETPGIDALEPRQTDNLDGTKRSLPAAHAFLGVRTNNQRHGTEPRQCLAMRIPDKRTMSPVRVTTRS